MWYKTTTCILLCITSLVLSTTVNAQEHDSLNYKKKYGLRLGVNLASALRTAAETGFSGWELQSDIRIADRFFVAAEIGNQTRLWLEDNLEAEAKGSYAKVGVNFNAYRNWKGMQNEIFVGLRYGFAAFSQELKSYTIAQTQPIILPDPREVSIPFNGLTASWIELIFGVKTEILNNLYLSAEVQLKRKISETKPSNFSNLIIPGFNRTYDFSEIGTGYAYYISYIIPIIKR